MLTLLKRFIPSALKPGLKSVLNRRALDFVYWGPGFQTYVWHQLVKKNAAMLDAVNRSDRDGFMSFVLSQNSQSRAQVFQDLWVLWMTKIKTGGFFVEFGATNGIDLSNTFLLEKRFGWSGILAEPFPYWHGQLSKNRSAAICHQTVWRTSGETMSFVASEAAPEYAGLEVHAAEDGHSAERMVGAKKFEVTTISLLDLLIKYGAPKKIDYLSIDTEGTELEILSAFDFDRFDIALITVEHNGNESKRNGLHSLLKEKGFERMFESFSLWDDWYVNPAHLASSKQH